MQYQTNCPLCSSNYCIKGSSVYAHRPLILCCGHTFCETCVQKRIKNAKVSCPKCKEATKLILSSRTVRPPPQDVYMSGLLALHHRNSFNRDASINSISYSREKAPRLEKIKSVRCFECHMIRADSKCVQCNVPMCDVCFEKVHSRSVALKMHQIAIIEQEKPPESSKPSTCDLHNNRVLEYYCEDDSTNICSRCVIMGDHKGHTIIAVEEKNQRLLEQIKIGLPTANVVVKKLKNSLKSMSTSVPDEKDQPLDAIKDIRNHFHFLHAKLQSREHDLVQETLIKQKESPSYQLNRQMNQDLKDIENAIKSAQDMLNNTEEFQANINQVLNCILKAKDIPCCFSVSKDSSEGEENSLGSLRFSHKEELVNLINTHGKLDYIDEYNKVRVLTLREAPEEITEEDLESASDFSNYSESFHSYPVADVKENKKIKNKETPPLRRPDLLLKATLGHVERVLVTHMKSPSDFMIQRCSDSHKVTNLMKQIEIWCNSVSANSSYFVVEVNIDDFVLAKYSLDNRWYRGRVKKVTSVSDGLDGETYSQLVDVLYVDYGNSETVSLDRLRLPPKRFFKDPEYVIKCCLPDVTSPSEDDVWSEDTIKAFASIVNSKALTMTVLKEMNDTWHVDLCTPPLSEIRDDIPTSVKDALVFMGYAKYKTNASSLLLGPPTAPCRNYPSAESRFVSEVLDVMVTYVNSPDHFYIQKLGEEYRYLADSMKTMQQMYNAVTKDQWVIYCPIKNLVCACRCPDDGYWYRAKIMNVPGKQQVNVWYVDYGNMDKVSYLSIRKLVDEFLILPIQAKRCKLAYVEPVDPVKGWTDEAKAWLAENLLLRESIIKIIALNDLDIEVILQDLNSGRVINQAIIDLGLAKKTAAAPKVIPKASEESVNVSISKKTAADSKCDGPELKETMSDTKALPRNSKNTSHEPEMMGTHVEVTMASFNTPAEFYLHVIANIHKLKRLMSELSEFYRNSEAEPGITPRIDTSCVAYCSYGDKGFGWYRARIKDILHNNLLKVFLVDYGDIRIVQVSFIRPLDASFVNLPFAMKCHLSGYMPAGDTKEWSKTACEYTMEDLKDKKYFIVKQGDIIDGSIPVDLLIEVVIPETALEPTCKEYYSLGKKLQEKGLAIPTRSLIIHSNIKHVPPVDESSLINAPDQHYKPYPQPSEDLVYVIPTYVDDEGIIFAHECVKSGDKNPVEDLNKCLGAHFEKTYPNKPSNIAWKVGNSCLSFYESENSWARAKILEVQSTWVKVCYIDFGNQELVTRNKLRSDIEPVLHLMPLCVRLVLHGISPTDSEKWTKEVIEFMHATVVGQLCGIQVMGTTDKRISEVRLISPDGKELGNVLCEKEYAFNKSDFHISEEQSKKIEHVLQICNPYKSLEVTVNQFVSVLVTHVELPNVIYFQNAQRTDDDDKSKEVNAQLVLLEELTVKLNKYGNSAPVLLKPTVGQACLCQFTYDNCWYRCLIADCKESEMLVLYVDYGTSEYIDPKRVRELPLEYLSLPSQAVRCVLKGIKPTSEAQTKWTPEALKGIIHSVIDKELRAVVKSVGSQYEVELYHLQAGGDKLKICDELAYQNVINSGLVDFKRSDI